jgi:type VI secretion system protein ImpE
MTAAELFREGKLNEAVEAAIAAVKQKPTDLDARYTLAQMLCFAGDLERAASGHALRRDRVAR